MMSVIIMGPNGTKRGTAVVKEVKGNIGVVVLDLSGTNSVTGGDCIVKISARPMMPLMSRGI